VVLHSDGNGRVPFGPLRPDYYLPAPEGRPVAPLPAHLTGVHVTVFGPPDSADGVDRLLHCARPAQGLADEPAVIGRLVQASGVRPKWGADGEDSVTPTLAAVRRATELLTSAAATIATDPSLATPLFRVSNLHTSMASHVVTVPGDAAGHAIALPLHLYQLGMHLFHNHQHAHALTFYVRTRACVGVHHI
jgi:hypothetical protein